MAAAPKVAPRRNRRRLCSRIDSFMTVLLDGKKRLRQDITLKDPTTTKTRRDARDALTIRTA
jgi:hypothetical protein